MVKSVACKLIITLYLWLMIFGISFSRYIGIVNDGQDLNLNQDLYRIYNASSPLRG